MNQSTDILHEAKRLRLLAAALELQHYTSTAANVVPIPGGDRVIAIGTPAQVRELLEIAPMGEASIKALDAIDSVTGADVAQIAAFETERFYLADDVNGLIARCRRSATLQQLVEQAQGLALPPKPHTTYNGYSDGSEPLWTAEQMENYARAAVVHAAAICDGVADKSKNSLFRSGAKICAGEIRTAMAGEQTNSEGGHHD